MNNDGQLPLFLSLYNGNYRRMCFFIKALLPTENDLEDIMQEVSVVLWEKFSSFQVGSNFSTWAYKIIQYEVLSWKRRKSRERILFDDELLDAIAERIQEKFEGETDIRFHFLLECTSQLPTKLYQLIYERYYQNKLVEDMAQMRRRSVEAVYQQLSRIRALLRDCISKKLQSQ